jgi:hypothetical protein
MKKGEYDIPFDKNGNQLDYELCNTTMIPNFVFEDELTLKTYGRGRSSVTFTLTRTDGKTVSMFVSDFTEMVNHMVKGKIKGKFTFVKKGQNYGCKLIEAIE